MKSLSSHILESFEEVNEGKMSGLTFTYMGKTHVIDKITDGIVKTSYGKEFRVSTLESNGVVMPVPEKIIKDKNKNKTISSSEYKKICKQYAGDGGAENASDMAENAIAMYPSILERIKKDYPNLRTSNQLKERLQWDIEAFA